MARRPPGCYAHHDLGGMVSPSGEAEQIEMAGTIKSLLTGNDQFVVGEFASNEEYYRSIATKQTPKVLWIGCSDSRVSEHQMTGSKPGTMFVHRNVANIVAFNDVNISAILEYGVVHLGIEDIIICGHTRCGGIVAIEDGVAENYIADWLCIATGAKEAADRIAKERKLSREEKLAVLTEENVKLQIKHLSNLALIRNMHAQGSTPRIHGWLYRVEDGTIDVIVDGRPGRPVKPRSRQARPAKARTPKASRPRR